MSAMPTIRSTEERLDMTSHLSEHVKEPVRTVLVIGHA
jgi:hypothetical protein